MKRLAVPAEVEAGGTVRMDIGVLEGRGQDSARDAADLTARFVVVALFTLLATRIAGDFLETGRLTGLLLLASETLVVVLTVMRRSSSLIDRSPRARVLTAISMMGPFLVRPAAATALAPEAATVLLSGAGLSVVIGGKLSLGRSFGLMPANRGIVSSGLYGLGGAMWSLRGQSRARGPSAMGARPTFAFTRDDWPASLADGSTRPLLPYIAIFMIAVCGILSPFLIEAIR